MVHEERLAIQCDLLVFVATQTEEEQLLKVATEFGIAVEQRASDLGNYYHLGRVGDSILNAVRVEMGPMSYGGSASAGILFRQATAATGIIQLGMAFGVDRNRQAVGDVLVSTASCRTTLAMSGRKRIDTCLTIRGCARTSSKAVVGSAAAG